MIRYLIPLPTHRVNLVDLQTFLHYSLSNWYYIFWQSLHQVCQESWSNLNLLTKDFASIYKRVSSVITMFDSSFILFLYSYSLSCIHITLFEDNLILSEIELIWYASCGRKIWLIMSILQWGLCRSMKLATRAIRTQRS